MSDRAARETCLVLMLKAPARSKRRLAAEIGRSAAAEAAAKLAACALEDLASWPGPTCVAPAAAADLDWLAERSAAEHTVVLQSRGNLGVRINRLNRTLHARGLTRQIFIGIDCPEIDCAYLRRAAALLGERDAVLGPADDGGVVLMGARRPWPPLRNLEWSTPRLGAQLRAACEAAGFGVAALDPRADIDTFTDLIGLGARLGTDRRPAREALAAWLASLAATRDGR
ncbi:MAG TPA: DUF2064 domain-containing protein [Gammaproteobacteria bacterium]